MTECTVERVLPLVGVERDERAFLVVASRVLLHRLTLVLTLDKRLLGSGLEQSLLLSMLLLLDVQVGLDLNLAVSGDCRLVDEVV